MARTIPILVLLALVWKTTCFSPASRNLPSTLLTITEPRVQVTGTRSVMVLGWSSSAAAIANEDTPSENENNGRFRSIAQRVMKAFRPARVISYALAFALGARVGALRQQSLAASSGQLATPVRGTIRRFPVLFVVLAAVAIRDTWSLIPSWAKPGLLKRRSSSMDDDVDPNDMTSVGNIASKLGAVYEAATKKLQSTALSYGEVNAAFLALLLTMGQIKEREAHHRDKLYETAGTDADPKEVLEGLDEAFEFADWAYDESPTGTLRENLDRLEFNLLKHDKTAEPGYVGHYIAVSKKRKLVLVGVKGTSSFEDMLTDCCGNAVSYQLPAPFVEGGDSEIRCHEGVLLSAERLANDIQPFIEDFVLPTDYDILITGHSLGAGAAALLTILLRARVPSLRGGHENRVRVLAFASPPVLSYDSALACVPFMTTIVNNSDVVPRMSLSNAIAMVEFLKFVDTRLEEKGMDIQNWKGIEAFMRMLLNSKEGEMIMSSQEVQDRTEKFFENVDPRDPDHLYVPGRVIQMYDTWAKGPVKETDGDRDDDEDARTAERVHIADGYSSVLRMIELDSRMLSDHMADAYRSSLKSLLTA